MGKYTTVTVTVDADVYVDDVIGDIEDQELVDELISRGYYVAEGDEDPQVLDKDDWRKLEEILTELPYHWENEVLRRKIMEARMKS
jgi:hypothetical protein